MEISKYINDLIKYIGSTFQYELVDNILRVYVDNETYYEYDYINRSIEMSERNNRVNIGSWPTNKFSNLNFALLLFNHFNKIITGKMPDELESCDCLETLQNIVSRFANNSIYSIGSIVDDKLSIVYDDEYTILFSHDGEIRIIDSDTDCEYIFGRFFNELLYLESFLENLKKYESCFDEKFTTREIIDVVGY